jgi:hypothetical protein
MSVVVEVTPFSNIGDLLQSHPDALVFAFPEGEYYLTKTVTIDRPNVQLISRCSPERTVIRQESSTNHGIVVKSSHFLLDGFTFDSTQAHYSSLLITGGHHITVRNCHFIGNENSTTVDFSGPEVESPVGLLENFDMDELGRHNRFERNSVHSQAPLVFRQQMSGTVARNFFHGGKVVVGLSKTVSFSANSVCDSQDDALLLELPSQDVTLTDNLLVNPGKKGLAIAPFDQELAETLASLENRITARGNTIKNCQLSGISVQGGRAIQLLENLIGKASTGIELRNCQEAIIDRNFAALFSRGVDLRGVDDSEITRNIFLLVGPTPEHVIHVNDDEQVNSRNVITGNTVKGELTIPPVSTDDLSNSNIVRNNTVQKYYHYHDEKKLQKII